MKAHFILPSVEQQRLHWTPGRPEVSTKIGGVAGGSPKAVIGLRVAVMASGVAWASPHKGLVDPTSISTCGTLSGNNTICQLTANITTASTGNCIVLSGSNDTLNLDEHLITGPGGSSTGAGVKITGGTDVVEGFNATISGFAVGVLDSGSKMLAMISTWSPTESGWS